MQPIDKLSYRIFTSMCDDYVIPCLLQAGFAQARKEEYEQKRDDTINKVSFWVRKDRRIDYCIVSVLLSITYRQPGDVLARFRGSKKKGFEDASICVTLDRLVPPNGSWDRGLGDPTDWSNLIPEKDPTVLGPVLVDQLREFAIPFFEARSSVFAVLDPNGVGHPKDLFEKVLLLKPASLWITGDQKGAINLLDSKIKELEDDVYVKKWPAALPMLESAKNFREFLTLL